VNDKNIYSSFIDSRDSNEYKIVKIGNDWWMAENLSFIDEYIGKSYRNSDVLKEKFGALYNFNEAQVVVPKGWKIPSDDDWQKLERSIGIDSVQAFEMGFRGSNVAYILKPFGDSGFEVLKAGAYSKNYYNIERNAYFWTSSAIDSVYAYCREINQKSGVGKFKDKKSMCFSVRCIKIKK